MEERKKMATVTFSSAATQNNMFIGMWCELNLHAHWALTPDQLSVHDK